MLYHYCLIQLQYVILHFPSCDSLDTCIYILCIRIEGRQDLTLVYLHNRTFLLAEAVYGAERDALLLIILFIRANPIAIVERAIL